MRILNTTEDNSKSIKGGKRLNKSIKKKKPMSKKEDKTTISKHKKGSDEVGRAIPKSKIGAIGEGKKMDKVIDKSDSKSKKGKKMMSASESDEDIEDAKQLSRRKTQEKVDMKKVDMKKSASESDEEIEDAKQLSRSKTQEKEMDIVKDNMDSNEINYSLSRSPTSERKSSSNLKDKKESRKESVLMNQDYQMAQGIFDLPIQNNNRSQSPSSPRQSVTTTTAIQSYMRPFDAFMMLNQADGSFIYNNQFENTTKLNREKILETMPKIYLKKISTKMLNLMCGLQSLLLLIWKNFSKTLKMNGY